MSIGKVLLWAGVILLICYLGNINLGAVISGLVHGAAQIHQQNSGG